MVMVAILDIARRSLGTFKQDGARVKTRWIRATRYAAACFLFQVYDAGTVTDAFAAETTFGLDAGIGRTDNIFRTPTDPRAATIEAVGALFSISELTNRFQVDLSGNLEYQRYSVSSLPGEIVGSANARGKIVVIPELFEWRFSDNFGQTPQRQFEAVTPINRENINYLTTGPRFTLPLNSRNRFALEGTYSKVDYEYTTELNNQRYRGAVSYIHDLTALSSVSLNVFSERVSYHDPLINPPTDQREAYVRYVATGARTTLALDAGYEREQHSQTTITGPVFRLDASRATSRNSTLSLLLGREFSDAGSLYSLLQDRPLQVLSSGNASPQIAQPTSEPFLNTYGELTWQIKGQQSTLAVSLSRYKASYQTLTQFDQTRSLLHGTFDRQLTSTLEVYLDAILSKNVNAIQYGNTTDHDLLLGLTQRIGRQLSLGVQYDRLDRSAVQSINASKVNEVWVRIFYGSSLAGNGSLARRSQ